MKQRDYGEWFGYPTCCIDHFVSGEEVSQDQYKAANYTGFVPCPEHAKKVLSGEISLESLVKGRRCRIPFPGNISPLEKRYTKIFLHPKWQRDWKSRSWALRMRGMKLHFRTRGRRAI